MNYAQLLFAVALAASCVRLSVRIVNRQERWEKRTLAAMIVLPVLYVVSIGPAEWLWVYAVPDSLCSQCRKAITTFYSPLTSLAEHSDLLDRTVGAYLDLWIDGDEVADRLREEFRQKWEKQRLDPAFKVDTPEPSPTIPQSHTPSPLRPAENDIACPRPIAPNCCITSCDSGSSQVDLHYISRFPWLDHMQHLRCRLRSVSRAPAN